MKAHKYLFVLMLLLMNSGILFSKSNERFWISFGGADKKYLMAVDILGNILIPPFKVSQLGHHKQGRITALSFNGSTRLDYWFISPLGNVYRVIVDKSTLQSVRWIDTKLTGALGDDDSTLNVTNRKSRNLISLLMATPEAMELFAYSVDELGQVNDNGFVIPPPLSGVCGNDTHRCKASTMGNARFAYWIEKNSSNTRMTNLTIRPIGPRGHPILKSVSIDKITSHGSLLSTFGSADATSTLLKNERFLVFTKIPIPGLNSLVLQRIDAVTGAKLGGPITLLKSDFLGNELKIDPKGRFVIFQMGDPHEGGNGVTYLALDKTGHPSGNPILLSHLAIAGIDLLLETLN